MVLLDNMIFHIHKKLYGVQCQPLTSHGRMSLSRYHLQNTSRSSCILFYVKYLNKMQNENHMYFSLMHIKWVWADTYDLITENVTYWNVSGFVKPIRGTLGSYLCPSR